MLLFYGVGGEKLTNIAEKYLNTPEQLIHFHILLSIDGRVKMTFIFHIQFKLVNPIQCFKYFGVKNEINEIIRQIF